MLTLAGTAWAHEAGSLPPATGKGATPQAAPSLADYDTHRLKLGGDFTLINQQGRSTRLKDFRSQVVLLFFGYTYCPDLCPLTTVKMARIRKLLQQQGVKMQPLLVSIDPERDTPARLTEYLAGFDKGIVGLTGSMAAIQKAAGLFRASAKKEEELTPGQYLMSHTLYLYMLDGRGRLRYLFPADADDELLMEGVRHLVHG